MDRHKSVKVQLWVPQELYDLARELVDHGELFASMSELVRKGMQYVVDEYSGYNDMLKEEIASKYGPNDMGAWIYTGTCHVRVNARWQALYGTSKMGYMIEDINDNPMPHAELEAKYGTPIEILTVQEFNAMRARANTMGPRRNTLEDDLKETWAYKEEHGLL